MAGTNVGSVFFDMSLNNSGFRQKIQDEAKYTEKTLGGAFSKLGKLIGAGLLAKGIYAFGKQSVKAYEEVIESQARLRQVMSNTMRASNAQFNEIIKLTEAYQDLGIVEDNVQQAGLQELGTYVTKTSSLKKLLPVMNDMAAQQYGFNVTAQSTVGIAGMMGKVLDGQTGALSRYGYKFTENQEKLLKFGTEEQRVATLAEVVTSSVGGMNKALAETPTGRLKQIRYAFEGIGDEFGKSITLVFAQFSGILTGVANKLVDVLKLFNTFLGKKFNMNATSGIGSIGDAAEESEDKAKKLMKALAGFDEINLLGTDDTNSISFPKPPENSNWENEQGVIEETTNKLTTLYQYLEPLKNISFENIANSFERLRQSVSPFTQDFFSGLNWAYFNLFIPFSTFVIQDFIPAFMDLLSASLDALYVVIEVLKPSAIWLWDSFLQPAAEWTGGVIIEAIKSLTNAFKGFSDWTKENKEAVELMSSILLGFFAGLWTYNTTKNIAKFITGSLIPAFMDFKGTMAKIISPTSLAVFAIGALAAGIIYLSRNWDKLTPAQRTITILGGLAAALTAAAIAVAVFHTTWTVGIAAAAIAGGLALLAGTYLFTMSNAKLPSIGGGGGGGGGGSLSGGESMMKTISKGTPLPQLANGGIANQPMLAMIGEYSGARSNPEIVTPENLMRKIVREELGNISLGGADVTVEVPVYLDSRVIFDRVKKISWEEYMRSGASPFPVG